MRGAMTSAAWFALSSAACSPPPAMTRVDAIVDDAAVTPDVAIDAPSRCPNVTARPDVDPWSVRLPSAGFGGISTTTAGGHTDVSLASPASMAHPAGYVRIGARLDWGGSIVFFGLGANAGSNVIDANDPGRELQLAMYDATRSQQPCAATATCVSSPAACGNSITYLGWNPVQGGDECGHGATSTQVQAGDALRLTVHPLHWNPDWSKPNCTTSACSATGLPVDVTYTIDLRFVTTHVVEIMTEVSSQETFDHPVTTQEFPTLYVAHGQGGPDLPVLLDAQQNVITLATVGNDGFRYDNFTSSAPWVSWQSSSRDYGVGLAMDQGITSFQGWRGDGTAAPYFHNVRAQISFAVRAGKRVRGLSYLALGSIGTVSSELTAVLAARPPFGMIDAPGGELELVPGVPLAISGWVLDGAAIGSVTVEIDGAAVASLPVGIARPDVCDEFAEYGGCPAPGFAGDVPTTGLAGCHLLRVIARDATGNATTLGERVLVASP